VAVNISLYETTEPHREFALGRFNEGKKTIEKTALTCARKYKNLVGKLGCGTWVLRIGSTPPKDIPIHNIQWDL